MNWDDAVNAVRPHVVKIETPSASGTGFLSVYNDDHSFCGIATAAHVVSRALEWQEPIKIWHEPTRTMRFLKAEDRFIYFDQANDSAVILMVKEDLKLPDDPIPLLPMDHPCSIGSDVGWLGYPAIEPWSLCFFAGTVSARQDNRKSYLIDGVAIHGVSGGPVFHSSTCGVMMIGCVSAYHANRASGEALPGLLRAQDVSHFHGVASRVRSLDEARRQEEEQKQKVQTAAEATTPLPPTPSIEDGAASSTIN
jgi:Trypsin-like peptidase domain